MRPYTGPEMSTSILIAIFWSLRHEESVARIRLGEMRITPRGAGANASEPACTVPRAW
jgi:hypothetical protein